MWGLFEDLPRCTLGFVIATNNAHEAISSSLKVVLENEYKQSFFTFNVY